MKEKQALIQRGVFNALTALVALGLLVALAFSLNALLRSNKERSLQITIQPKPERYPSRPTIIQSPTSTPLLQPSPTLTIIAINQTVGIDEWKTYTNHEFGFTIKYPPDLTIQKESWLQVGKKAKGIWVLRISDISKQTGSASKESIAVQISPNPQTHYGKPITTIEDSFLGYPPPTYYEHQGYPALRFETEVFGPPRSYTIAISILKDGVLWRVDGSVLEGKLERTGEIRQALSTFRFIDQ